MPSPCWCRRPASPVPRVALRDFADLAQQPGFLREVFARLQAPDAASVAQLYRIADSLMIGAGVLLLACFAARPLRDLWERRAGVVHLTYSDRKTVDRRRPASPSSR